MIWRAKGDLDRAIADTTEAIRLAKAKAPVNIMTPPGSVLISAYIQRGLAYEAKGDFANAKQDYNATLEGVGVRRRQQGQPGHRKGSPVAAVGGAAPAPRDHAIGAGTDRQRAAARVAAAAAGQRGRRVALVIGNGAYAHVTALPNPPTTRARSPRACATSASWSPKASTSTARRCRR